jgi:hypothetical protein
MNIRLKTCDNLTRKEHLFLDRSSTNIDTLVPSLSSASKPAACKSFDCCLRHFHTTVLTSSSSEQHLLPSCIQFYVTNTSHRKQEIYFFMNILCIESFAHQEHTSERCSSVVYFSSKVAILTTKTSIWTCACASATYIFIKLDRAAT